METEPRHHPSRDARTARRRRLALGVAPPVAVRDIITYLVVIERRAAGSSVGVIRVAESVDTPHIVAGTGALFVRLPGGKEPVTDHRTLLEMARRGQEARSRAARDLYGLPLVESELNRAEGLPGETPLGAEEPARVIEWIVRVRPLTVPGHFGDRALTASTGQAAAERMSALVPASPMGLSQRGGYQARARGLFASALALHPTAMRCEIVVDAGGVVATGMVMHRMRGVAHLDSVEHLIVCRPKLRLLRAATDTLTELDALGRAAASLEAVELTA